MRVEGIRPNLGAFGEWVIGTMCEVTMRFPSIKDVERALRDVNANVEGACDVRLQVYEDGQWAIRWGDASYDTDHRGYWGASSVPGVVSGKVQRFDAEWVARELLEQAKDQAADNDSDWSEAES